MFRSNPQLEFENSFILAYGILNGWELENVAMGSRLIGLAVLLNFRRDGFLQC